jgi:GT2 family glycosyltransferase
VAIVYEEPFWTRTYACLESLGIPVVYVDRGGVGSLAEAYNRGFREAPDTDLVWFVSDVTFAPGVLPALVETLRREDLAAVHPSFVSDHGFCRPDPAGGVVPAPFLEFTALLVRCDVFASFPLDERMPYWGHDLDWGWRVRHAGHRLGVDRDVTVEHCYLRNKVQHPATLERARLRRSTDGPTRRALAATYGANWRAELWPT